MKQEKEIKKFARAFNKKYGAFTYSGEMAIEVALNNINVENKGVILPNNICYRVLLSILRCKGIPIFIEPKNFILEKEDLKKVIKKYHNISTIIVVHQYGIKANVKEIKEQINNSEIQIIEDIAQGWGLADIGKYSDYVVTSFGKSKPLSFGIGGAIFSDYENMKDVLDSNPKMSRISQKDVLPYLLPNNIIINYNKMKKIGNKNVEKQRNNAKLIKKVLIKDYNNEVKHLDINDGVWNRFPICIENEDIYISLLEELKYYKIEYELPYKIKLNELPILKKYKHYNEINNKNIRLFCYINKSKKFKKEIYIKMENKTIKVINPNEYGSLLYGKEEENALLNVMQSRRIFRYSKTIYPYVEWFENELSKKIKCNYSLGVVNGTAGLITALKAINIKKDDKVLISSYTYIATALAVKLSGGIPVPLNIDFKYGIDLEDLKSKLDNSCKAVIVTHLQGRCFDLNKVKKTLKDKKIYLIEDACQGFAANCNNIYAGTFGDIGVYSFQQFKQISSGEGGAIVTNDKSIYERARNYTDMGSVRNRFPSWNSDECLFGQNYRMNNLTGGILFEQLKKLDYMIEKQQKSRETILNLVNKKIKIKNYINSSYPNGDTGMNIIIIINKNYKVEKIIEKIKEKYNVELRKMWNGLYFDNELFKKENLTDKDFIIPNCDVTKKVISQMLVMSVPPILTRENEKIMASVLIELKNKDVIE